MNSSIQHVVLLLIAPCSMFAQTNKTVLPQGFDSTPGGFGNSTFYYAHDSQQMFRATATGWETPVNIQEIAFRAVSTSFSGNAAIPHVEIWLTTSSRTFGQMTPVWDLNKGDDARIVFSQDNFQFPYRGGVGANPFDFRFHFDQGFTYDPAAGNLVMLVKTSGLGLFSPASVDQVVLPSLNAPIASVLYDPLFPNGAVVSGWGMVTEFTWTPIPEPSISALVIFGACSLFSRRRLRK